MRDYFTVEEANAQVPELRQIFDRIMQIRAQLKTLSARLESRGTPVTSDDLAPKLDEDDPGASLPPGEEEVRRDRGVFRALVATLREHIDQVQETGAVVKDLEVGLVDWYAIHEGREILLCWRYGEPEVAWWHELDDGFRGRRPVAELLEREPHP